MSRFSRFRLGGMLVCVLLASGCTGPNRGVARQCPHADGSRAPLDVETAPVASRSPRAAERPRAPGDSKGTKSTLSPHADERPYLSNIVQLTSQDMGLLNAGEAYFSPDGNTIGFQATPMGEEEYQIYTLNLQTGKLALVSTGEGACTCVHFRPDGQKIIFASTHLAPNFGLEEGLKEEGGYAWKFHKHMDIFEADPDGSNLVRLTDTPGYDAESTYSPDGKRIVFASKRDGDIGLYVMNADGSDQHRITHERGYDGGAFFSPDGQRILYRGDHRDDGHMNLQLRMVNADGTNDRALTDNQIFNWCPYWHPSGQWFIFTQTDHAAYSRGKRPNYDLFLVPISKAGEAKMDQMVRITYDGQFDGLPVFSPDGKRLMWTSKRGPLEESQIFIADFTLP